MPVWLHPEGARLILTKRASHLKHHPGQIAFPGGKVDDGDDGVVGAALREAQQQCGSIQRTQAALRDAFETRLQQALPGLQVISAKAPRLWNTSLLIMPRHRNLKWLTRLGRLGFAVSTGSACSSGHDGASPLLQALDLPWEQCQRVLRLSGGWQQDEASWQALAAAIEQVAEQLDAQA